MTQAALIFCLVGLATGNPLAVNAGSTVLAKGLFSYQAPPGWTVESTSYSKYPVAIGPRSAVFTPLINVGLANFDGSLDDYIAACRKTLTNGDGPAVKEIDRRLFVTTAGLDGVRAVYSTSVKDREARVICYYFDVGSPRKLLVTATCLARAGKANQILVDAAIKTLTLE